MGGLREEIGHNGCVFSSGISLLLLMVPGARQRPLFVLQGGVKSVGRARASLCTESVLQKMPPSPLPVNMLDAQGLLSRQAGKLLSQSPLLVTTPGHAAPLIAATEPSQASSPPPLSLEEPELATASQCPDALMGRVMLGALSILLLHSHHAPSSHWLSQATRESQVPFLPLKEEPESEKL